MPHFIKTGFWEKARKGPFGWLDLEDVIRNVGGAATWGNITGTLSNQSDLQTALNTLQTNVNTVQTNVNTKLDVVNSAVVLTNAASIDLTATKHTLATSSAARTFTVSYTGDDITIEVTLSTTTSTFTFPATALCVSEGVASGDNLLALSGVSGDKYIIGVKKIGSAYYVVAKNFGQ